MGTSFNFVAGIFKNLILNSKKFKGLFDSFTVFLYSAGV